MDEKDVLRISTTSDEIVVPGADSAYEPVSATPTDAIPTEIPTTAGMPVAAQTPVQPQQPYGAVPPTGNIPPQQPQQPGAQGPQNPQGPWYLNPVTALIFGIASIVLSFLPVLGIVLGIVAIVLATKYLKEVGVVTTVKAGRICGMVGIAGSILFIIMSLVTACMTFSFLGGTYGAIDRYSNELYDAYTENYGDIDELLDEFDAADKEADYAAASADPIKVADAKLDTIKNHKAETMGQISNVIRQSFDDAFEEAGLGFTLYDTGVDPLDIAQVLTGAFDFEDDGHGLIFPEESAKLYYDCTMLAATELRVTISEEMDSLVASMSDAGYDKARAAKELGHAIVETLESLSTVTYSEDILLYYEDDQWVLPDNNWHVFLENLFGFRYIEQ